MCMAWCILYRSALGPSRSPCGAAGGGAGGGGAAGGFPGTGMIDGGFFGAQASAATRAALTIARRIVRLFLGFRTSENGDHLGLFTRDLEQLPSPFAHVGSPADELFPLLGGGPEDTQVGDVLPVRRIRSWLRGHRGGSGETISRVLFTRWYEQMVISLGWLSPAISCGLPAAQTTRAGSRCLFGLAPTGGCRAAPVARRAVGSYPTVSPLPFGYKGGLFSVALFRRLAAPRRYLAVCPVELGLSSNGPSSQQPEREPVGWRIARVEREAHIGMQPSQLAPQHDGALGDRGFEPLVVTAQQAALEQRVVTNHRW